MRKLIRMLIIVICLLPICSSCSSADKNHKFGFICNGFDNEWFASMLDCFRDLGKQEGIVVLGSEHHGDVNALLEQAEQMISAGVDVLMFQNFYPAVMEEEVAQWVKKGTKVISYGAISETATANIYSSSYNCGFMIGRMAADWINENLADQERVDVYIHGHIYETLALQTGGFEYALRADGIEDALRKMCPKAVVVERQDVLGAQEPNAFEQSLISHPNIQVVCTIKDTSCINICEWWISELKGRNADLSRYAGFSVDAVDSGLALIAASRENKSIFRGTLDARDMGRTYLRIWDMVQKLWNGKRVDDLYLKYYPVTSNNIYEYGY